VSKKMRIFILDSHGGGRAPPGPKCNSTHTPRVAPYGLSPHRIV